MELRIVPIKGFLKKLSPFKFITVIVLCDFLISTIENILIILYSNFTGITFNLHNPILDKSILTQFINVCFIGPIFETLIFQVLIIKILTRFKIFKRNDFLTCLISSLIFASSHTYSFAYMLVTLPSGFLYAYGYLLCKDNKEVFKISNFAKNHSENYAFLMIFFSHALYNGLVLIENLMKGVF